MIENNPTVVAAEKRTPPAIRKLARAYVALARQLSGPTAVSVPVTDDVASSPEVGR